MKPATNTAFHMPPSISNGLQVLWMCIMEAWHIQTSWSVDDFLCFLMVVHPSLESLWALLDYANIFIWTRQAGGPVPGHHAVDRLDCEQMFMAPFCNRTGSSIVNLKTILFIACFKLAPSFFSHSLYKHLLLMGHV